MVVDDQRPARAVRHDVRLLGLVQARAQSSGRARERRLAHARQGDRRTFEGPHSLAQVLARFGGRMAGERTQVALGELHQHLHVEIELEAVEADRRARDAALRGRR